MQYSEPKITLLACAQDLLMASPDSGNESGNEGWNGSVELPPIPMG